MGRHIHIHLHDAEPIRAAGVICVDPAGRMLFLKRSTATRDHPETWCFPGGSIEPGESAATAARRETGEETGHALTATLVGPVDRRMGFATYLARLAEPFEPVLNDEHTVAVWAVPADAPRPLHPGVAATLGALSGSVGPRK